MTDISGYSESENISMNFAYLPETPRGMWIGNTVPQIYVIHDMGNVRRRSIVKFKNFRVPFCLPVKTSLSAKPFI